MDRAELDRLRRRAGGKSPRRHAAGHAACAWRRIKVHCRSHALRTLKGTRETEEAIMIKPGRAPDEFDQSEISHFGNCPVCGALVTARLSGAARVANRVTHFYWPAFVRMATKPKSQDRCVAFAPRAHTELVSLLSTMADCLQPERRPHT
jgi:hypothetical protein